MLAAPTPCGLLVGCTPRQRRPPSVLLAHAEAGGPSRPPAPSPATLRRWIAADAEAQQRVWLKPPPYYSEKQKSTSRF